MRLVRLSPALAGVVSAVLLLGGCETMQQTVKVDFTPPASVPAPAPVAAMAAPASGSLYHAASYRPSFEDRRARVVGDTVTIVIVENVSASQKSSSTVNRASSIDATLAAFPYSSTPTLSKLALDAQSSNDFSGKGGTESANTFSGSITTTVVEVLPNGHLMVTGEKQIGVNQNVDVLRFSGTIDPRAIQPNSIVSSNQVANVRLESRGRGAQAEAQTVGWLTRFFMSFFPF